MDSQDDDATLKSQPGYKNDCTIFISLLTGQLRY